MFDGSHRSRRTIDLGGGGGSRRRQRAAGRNHAGGAAAITTASSALRTSAVTGVQDHKSQVLESTRLLREERRLQQQQQKAAVSIQKTYRGWITRKHMATTIILMSKHEQRPPTNPTLVLSLRLSRPLRPFLDQSTMRKALVEYETIAAQQHSNLSTISARRIALAALEELVPPFSDRTESLARLLAGLLQMPGIPENTDVWMALNIRSQDWLWSAYDDESSSTRPSSKELTFWLWQQSCEAAPNTTEGLALLGSTVFCTPASSKPSMTSNGNLISAYSTDQLLESLVDTLLQSEETPLVTLVKQRVAGREGILIANALNDCQGKENAPCSLLHLLSHLLEQRQDVALLTCLVVRGENVRELLFSSNSSTSPGAAMALGEEDESDEMDEKEDAWFRPTISSSSRPMKRQASSSSRHSRQELQTVPKLDRLYETQFAKWRKDGLAEITRQSAECRESLIALATQIGDPAVWKTWGLPLLDRSGRGDADAYLTVLGMLLQSASGLRITRSTSPFISQLAFSDAFLKALWRQVLSLTKGDTKDSEDRSSVCLIAMTLFCDLFSHHLMAQSDEEFSKKYTSVDRTSNKVILMEDVVSILRGVLHELYWTKPVLASDFQNSWTATSEDTRQRALRARLLLSGSKLFTSLHERWGRMVMTNGGFNDVYPESMWLFPYMVSREEHTAPVVAARDMATDENESVASMDTSDDESDVQMSSAEQENETLADSFRDPKMARVLTCIPQVLMFERRVSLFNALIRADKLKTQDETHEFRQAMMRMAAEGRGFDDDMNWSGRERVQIRRDSLYDDAMETLNGLGPRLKKKVQVTFINEHGAEEAGIDGGGVFKEFLDDLIKDAFDPSRHKSGSPALFSVTPYETLAVDAATSSTPETLAHFEFLGRVLGKAVYESILVEPQFCLPFLNQLLGKQNSLEDLKNLDAEFYRNLIALRELDDLSSLGLTFETTLGSGSRRRTIELLPGGSSIPVTKQNVILYIHQVAHHRLNVQTALPTRAFLQGFRDLIPASWVRLFSAHELQKLISGDDTVKGIDVTGLKAAMQYAGGYHPSQQIMQWFWEVLDEMTPEQQQSFLRYVTSCSRQPLLGFRSLEPAPCVQQIRLPEETFLTEEAMKNAPLPTSATCMNLLKLPNYRKKELLRKKLIDAIESGSGFELT